MAKYDDLDTGSVFTARWTDAIQEFTGTLVAGLRLSLSAANTVSVAASTGNDQVAIGVNGLYRYRSATTTLAISGATGTYDLYATVSANNFSPSDTTDYNWYLAFVASGASAPTGNTPNAQAITATRKIGEVDWDNTASKITGLRQLTGAVDVTLPITPTAPSAAVVPFTVRGAASQTGNLLQIGSSSSATDRVTVNSAGQLALPVTGSTGGLLLGGDATLYRSASNTLRTSGGLIVDGAVQLSVLSGTIGFFGATPASRATGYGSGSMVGTKSALTAASTLNDVIAVVSSLVSDLRTYGLIAS